MHQPTAVPAPSLFDRLRGGGGRRTLAIALAVAMEALLLLALLTLGAEKRPGTREKSITLIDFQAPPAPEEAPAEAQPPAEAEPQPAPQQPRADEPLPPQPPRPSLPRAAEAPPVQLPPVLPTRNDRPAPAEPPRNAAPQPPAKKPVYGPPDRGGSPALRDTERVGTAPNGEPLYAAAWYREPEAAMMRAYLSTATGPGWGVIDCRTVANYRVEDCVGIDEYPRGSQIMRAALAAAWEFRVRPPRLGGKPQVGSWVRIRIDYEIKRRQRP